MTTGATKGPSARRALPPVPDHPAAVCAGGTPLVCSLCGVGLERLPGPRDWRWCAVSDGSTVGRNDKPEYDLATYLAMWDSARNQEERDRADYFRRNFYGWTIPWSSPAYSDAPAWHTHMVAQCPSWCDHSAVAAIVPDCCGWPMWHAPAGWTCRQSGALGGCDSHV